MKAVNSYLLKAVNATWCDPPSAEAVKKSQKGNKHIRRKLKERMRKKFWAIKDPRLSLLVTRYFPYLTGDIYLFCCIRKPDKVLESFKGRRYEEDVNIELIDHYNRSIVDAIEEFCELKDK